jgi:hypothetical protein
VARCQRPWQSHVAVRHSSSQILNCGDNLSFARALASEFVLGINKKRIPGKTSHDVGMQDVPHDFGTDGSQLHCAGMLRLVSEVLPRIKSAKQCTMTSQLKYAFVLNYAFQTSYLFSYHIFHV